MQTKIKRIDSSTGNLVIPLFNKYRIFYKQPSNLELAKNFIQARLHKNESVIFAAIIENKNEDTPIGFTQLYPKFLSVSAVKIWVLNDLFVEPEYRKQGVGESLINTAITYAREDGASHVELSTAVDNYTAQKLYETIGFKRQTPSSDFFNYKIDIR